MKRDEKPAGGETAKPFVEGIDFYFDDGLMVLTAKYLKDRGYCCSNDCRHCPYSDEERAERQSRNSSSSL
jgi:hypothetical protein